MLIQKSRQIRLVAGTLFGMFDHFQAAIGIVLKTGGN